MSRPSAAPDVVPFTPLADEYEMPLALVGPGGEPLTATARFRRARPGDYRLPFAPGWTLDNLTMSRASAAHTGQA